MKTKIAILGFGARGTMFGYIALDEGYELVAVCDVNEERRKAAHHDFGVKKERIFADEGEFFAQGKLADILIIATLDKYHYHEAITALKLGYDVLLEKPIALDLNEIIEIGDTARRLKRKIGVCHVLRYTPFYSKVKAIIDSGVLGEITSIIQTENVGYYHYAHSFVRGNWHNSIETCPMILAKCCHDFDLILWLSGKSCQSLSSFGSLTYFKEENAPLGATKRCKDCPVHASCPFDAYQIYTKYPTWVKQPDGYDYTVENAMKVLDDNNTFYDRCVFHSDNDVVDRQMVNLELEDGVLAHLTMHAFSGEVYRRTQVAGTHGELNGVFESGKIELQIFGEEKQMIDVKVDDTLSQHCGGDRKLLVDFVNSVKNDDLKEFRTSVDKSIESHKLAFYAEESRLHHGKSLKIK